MSYMPFQGTVHVPHEDRLQALDALCDVLPSRRASLLPLLTRTVRLLIVENRALHTEVANLREQLADHITSSAPDYDPGDE